MVEVLNENRFYLKIRRFEKKCLLKMIWQIGIFVIIHLDENNKLSVDFDY